MFYKCIKFEIERERISINVWFWQPLLIVLAFLLVFISHQQKIYALYSLVFILFPTLLMFYVYMNFLKAKSLIFVEINRGRLILNEPNNPFSKSINLPIDTLKHVFRSTTQRHNLKKIGFLYIDKKEEVVKLIRTKSFWYGEITNENLQELLFYLQQQNPSLMIEESLNEL